MNRRAVLFGALALGLLASACAPPPYRAGVPTVWRPSPNFGDRRPNLVVLHHTGGGSAQQALRSLSDPNEEISAHYVIDRDGTTYQLVDERYRAWHAGVSRWGADTDVNSSSLGIELVNDGREPFAEAQLAALLALLADLERRYGIPRENFVGHADVAPRRKVDPSAYFPWRTLAERGFGLWCDPPYVDPPASDALAALQALGYDVTDAAAAVRAFKLHYVREPSATELTQDDRALLSCLLRRRASPPEPEEVAGPTSADR